jgi:hypothetical protein
MSQEIHGAGGHGSRRSTGSASTRAYVGAFVVAAAATCLGGAASIGAVTTGASAVVSLSLLAGCVLVGFLSAVVVLRVSNRRSRPGTAVAPRSTRREQRRSARRDRRQLRRDRRELRRTPVCSPAIMLEEKLTTRYGVPVERVAAHVWRIDGELVEATLDPVSGQLMTGGRELQL